jgi:hypothetical protein
MRVEGVLSGPEGQQGTRPFMAVEATCVAVIVAPASIYTLLSKEL